MANALFIKAGSHFDGASEEMGASVKAPMLVNIDAEEHFIVADRSLPHSIIVNTLGNRFMNEAAPHCSAGQALYGGPFGKRPGSGENLPAWLIFDSQFRNRYHSPTLTCQGSPCQRHLKPQARSSNETQPQP